MKTIDLNSDLGEGMGDDDAMLSIACSANVACGFHAGEPAGILRTLRQAAGRGVAVGAHVSYADREHFGRRALDVPSEQLRAQVIYQIGALKALAAVAGTQVRYVKPHGALYNTIAHDRRQATDVIEAIRAVDPALALVGLAGSPLLSWIREAGLRPVAEAFADRAYTAAGALVPREQPGAVLHDGLAIAQRMARLAREGVVAAIDGTDVRVQADSICVHGDTPGAVEVARSVRAELSRAGIAVACFADAAGARA
ncbi:MAG: LamB/YcsF family protein [Burkholderiales bacterium]|nr:LamB/YcsF family protein [Burkholderiales bacterium]